MPRTTDQFVHQPLPTDSIRLVELLPGNSYNRIRCILSHHIFDDTLVYEGVSYTWGSPDRQMPIIVNGATFYIRRNLYRCLCRLRRTRQSLLLWIDAICIDQWSISERNHNVGMMDDIYSQARNVYAWLGESDEESHLAMSFLENEFLSAFVPGHIITSREKRGWNAVRELFNRPYWLRIWVVQEFVLAADVVLVCGEKQVPGTPVVDATAGLLRMYEIARKTHESLESSWSENPPILTELRESHAIRLMAYRAQNNTGVGSSRSLRRKIYMRPLSQLLDNFHLSRCTDLRDYFNAMLSLASDFYEYRRSFVDYSLSRMNLLHRVIAHYGYISRKTGLGYHELKAIAYLCLSFQIRFPERHGPYAFRTNSDSRSGVMLRAAIPDGKIRIDWRPSVLESPSCFRLSQAQLLQETGSVIEQHETGQAADLKWEVNVSDHRFSSYRDVLNAGAILSEYDHDLESHRLPVVLVCVWNTSSSVREYLKGLVCSDTREGDILVHSGFESHLSFVFRNSRHEEKKYLIVGTAMCEPSDAEDLLRQGSLNNQAFQLPIILGQDAGEELFADAEFWVDMPTLLKLVQFLHEKPKHEMWDDF